jgi:hypothetical protein
VDGKKIIPILHFNVVEWVVFQDVGLSQLFLKSTNKFRYPFRFGNT